MPLRRFPGVLFDPHGYVRFETDADYRAYASRGYLRIGEGPMSRAVFPGFLGTSEFGRAPEKRDRQRER